MAHLGVTLFGPMQITCDHQEIQHLESDKVRGLLAYLSVNHHRPHPRDALAELLWPMRSTEVARGNFRRALANLRSVLGDRVSHQPHLCITRDTVQFNLASGATVDVATFLELVRTPETHPQWAQCLKQAAALYRGPFLEGFHLDDCPEFEVWMISVANDLEQLAAEALHKLAHYSHAQEDEEVALQFYRRSAVLSPWNEAVHRGLMIALSATSGRGAALAHFAEYRRRLQTEFGIAPEPETLGLFSAIHEGRPIPVHETRFLARNGQSESAGSP